MSALLADLAFNALCEYLSPAEYDGRAYVTLAQADPRLSMKNLLAWELENARVAPVQLAQMLSPLRSFLASTVARDKIGRLVQCVCHIVMGLYARSSAKPLALAARRLLFALSDARRTFRLLEIGPYVRLGTQLETPPSGLRLQEMLTLASSASVALYASIDRVRWLQDRGLVSGKPGPTARRAMRMLCLSHAANITRILLRISSDSEHRDAAHGYSRLSTPQHPWLARATAMVERIAYHLSGGSGSSAAERMAHLRELGWQLLLFLQAAHLGHVVRTHNSFVGLLGVGTTLAELRSMWIRHWQQQPGGAQAYSPSLSQMRRIIG